MIDVNGITSLPTLLAAVFLDTGRYLFPKSFTVACSSNTYLNVREFWAKSVQDNVIEIFWIKSSVTTGQY